MRMMAFLGRGRCSASWRVGRELILLRDGMRRGSYIDFRLGRSKKVSGDFGKSGKGLQPFDSPFRPHSGQSSVVPSVIVSKEPPDDDDMLTSGQVSPVCEYSRTVSHRPARFSCPLQRKPTFTAIFSDSASCHNDPRLNSRSSTVVYSSSIRRTHQEDPRCKVAS